MTNREYMRMQDICGLKELDVVTVKTKCTSFQYGWKEAWVSEMDNYLNKTGIVQSIDEWGVWVMFENGRYYSFPFFALEKEEEPVYDCVEECKDLNHFDKVIVRDSRSVTGLQKWKLDYFGHYNEKSNLFRCVVDIWEECLPYEKYKHLYNTI